jgi:hypothetical protein
MRFKIIRASDYLGPKEAPCDGAVKADDGNWYIEIPDLAALMALQAAVNDDLIVTRNSIWIYDDYME